MGGVTDSTSDIYKFRYSISFVRREVFYNILKEFGVTH
jgi:hypothetical protein